MTPLHAILIAILQGATELFPVSSLGHAVVLPRLLGWPIDQHAPAFLPFLVLLHLGTAVALLTYFWRDWWLLAAGSLGLLDAHRVRESRRILLLLVVATIPAGVIGLALEHRIRDLFGNPIVAAIFLVVNGGMLLGGERLRRRAAGRETRPIATFSLTDAFTIGCWQSLALIPGISRSGATIVGGLLRGAAHENAAHFSFLIATPIILAATLKEVPKLLHADVAPGVFGLAAVAAVVSGIVAWLSTWFLMRYFRGHDNWALDPFAYYCLAFGGIAAAALGLGIL